MLTQNVKNDRELCGYKPDLLSPYNRLRIALLYCSGLKKASRSSFCTGPHVLFRNYYQNADDISLGSFLMKYTI